MTMKKIFILLCSLALPAFGSLPPEISGKILYLIHKHETAKALSCYLEEAKEPDFALLQQIGSRLIEEGAKSDDPETMIMTLFGAGISTSPDLLPALKKGIQSKELKHQLTALNFLGKLHDDEADQLIQQALSSPLLARYRKRPNRSLHRLSRRSKPRKPPTFSESFWQIVTKEYGSRRSMRPVKQKGMICFLKSVL